LRPLPVRRQQRKEQLRAVTGIREKKSMRATRSEVETSKYVTVSGTRIHYNEIGGEGPVVVCIHGGGPGANSWSNFSNNMDAFARDHRVILLDLPQFGKSDKIVIEGPRLTILAGMIRDAMDLLKVEKISIVGNSFGGQVGIKFAIDYPDRIASLVVIGSAPVLHSIFAPMPVEGVKLIGNYYRGEGGPTIEKMRQILKTLVFDQSLITEDVVRERYEASIDPDAIKVNLGPVPMRQDLTPEFPKVKAPTLVIWGMDDRAGALDIGLLMVRTFQNAQMHIFSRCGHWAQVEHADEFNELVLAFLARHCG
jgi:pimeloyl-ACP methyl ester carboxylesterase